MRRKAMPLRLKSYAVQTDDGVKFVNAVTKDHHYIVAASVFDDETGDTFTVYPSVKGNIKIGVETFIASTEAKRRTLFDLFASDNIRAVTEPRAWSGKFPIQEKAKARLESLFSSWIKFSGLLPAVHAPRAEALKAFLTPEYVPFSEFEARLQREAENFVEYARFTKKYCLVVQDHAASISNQATIMAWRTIRDCVTCVVSTGDNQNAKFDEMMKKKWRFVIVAGMGTRDVNGLLQWISDTVTRLHPTPWRRIRVDVIHPFPNGMIGSPSTNMDVHVTRVTHPETILESLRLTQANAEFFDGLLRQMGYQSGIFTPRHYSDHYADVGISAMFEKFDWSFEDADGERVDLEYGPLLDVKSLSETELSKLRYMPEYLDSRLMRTYVYQDGSPADKLTRFVSQLWDENPMEN